MWDNILDFIEDNKKLVITVGVVLAILIVCLVIRHNNLSKKENVSEPTDIADLVEVQESTEEVLEIVESKEEPTFDSYVGLWNEEEEEEETEPVDPDSLKYQELETLDVYCNVIGHTVVPKKNMDGSSCKAFQKKISVHDFEMFFGSDLTIDDVTANDYVLVGTESDKDGDLQSTGWLQANLSNIDGGTPIYFTNLHVIGSLSEEHVVLLCSYDWYSAFGLKDTLVLFEDISGTLSTEDYIDGDVISTVVWAKNIRMTNVEGQNIVHVEYAVEN